MNSSMNVDKVPSEDWNGTKPLNATPSNKSLEFTDFYLPCTDAILDYASYLLPSDDTNSSANFNETNCSWICDYNLTLCRNWNSMTTVRQDDQVNQLQFSLWITILIGVLTGLFSILTIAGNSLVLLSFFLERTIRQPSNYFIASLAVSDMMIGFISMPFFSVYHIMGKWTLGNTACDLWLAADYTVCLVSIYTVLLITIDRYCSVKIAAKYRSWRTKTKVRIMVSVTWIVPVLVFFVSIMGWDSFQGYRDLEPGTCLVQFLRNKIFNTSLIFGYFYSSLIVMLFLYGGIYRTAKSMQKKSAAKQKKMQMMVSMNRTNAKPAIAMSKTQSTLLSQDKPQQNISGVQSLNQNIKLVDQKSDSGISAKAGSKASTETTGFYDKKDASDQDRSSSPLFESDEEAESIKKEKQNQNRQNKSGKKKKSNQLGKCGKNNHTVPKIGGPPQTKHRHRSTIASDTTDVIQSSLLDSESVMLALDCSAEQTVNQERSVLPPSSLDIKPFVTFDNKPKSPTPMTETPSAHITTTVDSAIKSYIGQDASAVSLMSPIDVHNIPENNLSTNQSPHSAASTIDHPSNNSTLPASQAGSGTAVTNENDALISEKVETQIKANALGRKYDTQIVRSDEITQSTKGAKNSEDATVACDGVRSKRDMATSRGKRTRKKKRADNEMRQKSKSENRARKALRTISFIMGAFVICWTPYHIVALIEGFCMCTNEHLFYFTYFLCYANSPLNPFCYALANQQFKKTFSRILRGDFHKT